MVAAVKVIQILVTEETSCLVKDLCNVKPAGGSELFLATQTVDQPRERRLAAWVCPVSRGFFPRGRLASRTFENQLQHMHAQCSLLCYI